MLHKSENSESAADVNKHLRDDCSDSQAKQVDMDLNALQVKLWR